MYEQYWQVTCSPFSNTCEPEFYFNSETHHAALLKLRYLIEQKLGAGLLIGGTGYGKTFLSQYLCREMSATVAPVVHLFFPQMSPAELLAYIAVELGADEQLVQTADGSLDRIVRQLEQQLKEHTTAGRQPLVVVDEAHLIEDHATFQTLQLLLNFQQQKEIDFTLLLVGERTLVGQVQRMAQLESRIGVKALLQPLTREETWRYILHRLAVAGVTDQVFDESALDAVFELTGGVPRKINRLADLALLVGFAEQLTTLSAEQVEDVAEEVSLVFPD